MSRLSNKDAAEAFVRATAPAAGLDLDEAEAVSYTHLTLPTTEYV